MFSFGRQRDIFPKGKYYDGLSIDANFMYIRRIQALTLLYRRLFSNFAPV